MEKFRIMAGLVATLSLRDSLVNCSGRLEVRKKLLCDHGSLSSIILLLGALCKAGYDPSAVAEALLSLNSNKDEAEIQGFKKFLKKFGCESCTHWQPV